MDNFIAEMDKILYDVIKCIGKPLGIRFYITCLTVKKMKD
jgi:hypothetical protein